MYASCSSTMVFYSASMVLQDLSEDSHCRYLTQRNVQHLKAVATSRRPPTNHIYNSLMSHTCELGPWLPIMHKSYTYASPGMPEYSDIVTPATQSFVYSLMDDTQHVMKGLSFIQSADKSGQCRPNPELGSSALAPIKLGSFDEPQTLVPGLRLQHSCLQCPPAGLLGLSIGCLLDIVSYLTWASMTKVKGCSTFLRT